MGQIKYVFNIQAGSIRRQKKLSQFLKNYEHDLREAILSDEFEFLDQYYNTIDIEWVWQELIGEEWPSSFNVYEEAPVEETALPIQEEEPKIPAIQPPPVSKQEPSLEIVTEEEEDERSEMVTHSPLTPPLSKYTPPIPTKRADKQSQPLEPNKEVRQQSKNANSEGAKKVFIAYEQEDEEIAARLVFALQTLGITDIVQPDNSYSESIRTFAAKSVKASDITLAIVSPNSLLSAWVAQEANQQLKSDGDARTFITCTLNPDMYEPSYYFELIGSIQHKQKKLWKDIGEIVRTGENPQNLVDEHTHYQKLIAQIDPVLSSLKVMTRVDISGANLYNNLPQLIEAIR